MRVISGVARGRKFDAPVGLDTRPTLDRVKESVFGTIQFDIFGRVVLDLFAGSGNLGIESLSRGAKQAVFCDKSKTCTELIAANLKLLGLDKNTSVYNTDYKTALLQAKQSGIMFDLVFLDPPYATGLAQNAADELADMKLLSEAAIIVTEHSITQNICPPQGMYVHSRKTYRETAVTILKMEEQKQ